MTSVELDTARYRWLRQQNWFDGKLAVVVNPKESVKLGQDCPSFFRLDELIDAELKLAQPAASGEPFPPEDPVTVPRGLLGAACAAIERKHDAPKTLAALRRYTVGDLSATAQPAPAPVPLSQDAILDMAEGCTLQFHDLLEFARKVERAHGIGTPAKENPL